jgi:uncharacterized protein YcbK (DUF882 family)
VQDNANRLRMTRRYLLGLGAGALVSLSATPSWALVHKMSERSLAFQNLNTSESLSVVYWAEGRYVPQGLHEVNQLLRDYRTDEVKTIDPRLLDFLFSLKYRLDASNPFQVISGYRSPKTNAMLRRHSHSVARNSLHMQGKAIDIRLKGYKPSEIARAAREMQLGGVGTYSRFVHLDAGDVRVWRG